MIVLLGFVQLVLIIIICLYEYKVKSPSIFLWATLFIMFGVMHFLTAFMIEFKYSETVINKASIFVIFFCIIYIFTRIITNRFKKVISIDFKSDNTYNTNLLTEVSKRYCNIIFIVFIVCFYYKVYSLAKFSNGIFSSSWGSGRELSNSTNLVTILKMVKFLYFQSSAIILISYYVKKYHMFVASCVIAIINVIITRNRIEILPLICCIICIFIFNERKLCIKRLLRYLFLGVIIIYIVYGLRVFRHYGTINNALQNFNIISFNNKILNYIITGNGELGLRNDFYFFINGNNDFENFGHLNSYKRMLLVLLPTKYSLGLKPEDFAISMGYAINSNLIGYSTHPTLFGDCYANAGMHGVFLGIFWAIFVYIFDLFIRTRKKTMVKINIISCISVFYVIAGRGSVYNPYVILIYNIIFIYCFYFFSRVRFFKKLGEKK